MSREDPRKLIIEILKKHPEGLTIVSIAKIIGLHRHTSTKYIHELIGAGVILQRSVGAAKLCYLEKINDIEEKKLLERLEKRRSAEKYSLKLIFSVVLITFLLSEVAIFAYENNSLNETLSDNISINTSPLTSSIIFNESNISQMIETAIENSSRESVEINDSLIPISLPNETPPVEVNETFNDTPVIEIPIEAHPKFDIIFEYQQKITRLEEFRIKAYITNVGSSAKNILIDWKLPEGFEIISSNQNCDNLDSNKSCISEVIVKSSFSTALGRNDIKIVINYEE